MISENEFDFDPDAAAPAAAVTIEINVFNLIFAMFSEIGWMDRNIIWLLFFLVLDRILFFCISQNTDNDVYNHLYSPQKRTRFTGGKFYF